MYEIKEKRKVISQLTKKKKVKVIKRVIRVKSLSEGRALSEPSDYERLYLRYGIS
jgi:hypothetical protein